MQTSNESAVICAWPGFMVFAKTFKTQRLIQI